MTLEPCCHTQKRTPPCSRALIQSVFKKIVVADNCATDDKTFTVDVPSAFLTTPCTATLQETGVTAYVGC